MDTTQITELLREGVWVVIKVCGPMLLLSMLVGVLLAVLNQTLLSPALPAIMADLQVDATTVQC